MATRTSWREVATLLAEAEVRANDAVTLDAYRWNLLEASAHLSNAKLVIKEPTPVLDQTEADLLDSIESATNESIAKFLADLAPGMTGSQGRSR
jgi:uncharacterized membrane-anchored protein